MRPIPDDLGHAECTGRILRAFYDVYNELGPGFAERVYARALHDELVGRALQVSVETPLTMHYGAARPVRFRADLIVESQVVVEIKARSRILKGHWAQLITYLRTSGIEVGLLLNFGPKPGFKRLVMSRQQIR